MPPRLQPSPFTAGVDATEPTAGGAYRGWKQLGLVVLCGAWVVLGLVGHDPWKAEDATTFGVAWDMMNGGPVLTPTLVGQPYIDRPPLVYALGALSGHLFSPWLAPHDAARLAAGGLLVLTLWLIALTGRELAGLPMRWLPVLVFIGSIGLWDRAHQLSPELGLLAGLALAQYGWALGVRGPIPGGLLVGAGAAFAFLADGLVGPVWLTASGVLLPALSSQWHSRRYAASMGIALLVAAVGIAAWPVALALTAPAYLAAWWQAQSLGNFLAPLSPEGWVDPSYLPKNLPWFTWPALPLVVWTLWTRGRGFNGGLRSPAVQIPGALALAILLGLALMPEPRPIDAMILILPLALLGALEVDTLKRGFSGALDWFGILTFGLLAALAWWAWWDAYTYGMSSEVARVFRDTEVGYRPSFHGRAVAVCVVLTALWLALVRPARRSNRRAVLNWAAGSTLLWALYMTIWLPYLDSRRSYRAVAEEAAQHLPAKGCVAERNLGESQRALFYYFAGIVTTPEDVNPGPRCPVLLVQYGQQDPEIAPSEGWRPVWEGKRRGDSTERYVIYTRATRVTRPASRP